MSEFQKLSLSGQEYAIDFSAWIFGVSPYANLTIDEYDQIIEPTFLFTNHIDMLKAMARDGVYIPGVSLYGRNSERSWLYQSRNTIAVMEYLIDIHKVTYIHKPIKRVLNQETQEYELVGGYLLTHKDIYASIDAYIKGKRKEEAGRLRASLSVHMTEKERIEENFAWEMYQSVVSKITNRIEDDM